MINTLIIENDAIQEICTTVIEKINNINYKYAKSIQRMKKEYDLYIIFLSLEDYIYLEKILPKEIKKNLIIFIEQYTPKFLWNISNMYNPVDVILITTPKEIILERLENNIRKVESEVI